MLCNGKEPRGAEQERAEGLLLHQEGKEGLLLEPERIAGHFEHLDGLRALAALRHERVRDAHRDGVRPPRAVDGSNVERDLGTGLEVRDRDALRREVFGGDDARPVPYPHLHDVADRAPAVPLRRVPAHLGCTVSPLDQAEVARCGWRHLREGGAGKWLHDGPQLKRGGHSLAGCMATSARLEQRTVML